MCNQYGNFVGGWAKLDSIRGITGSIAIEFGNQTYVTALDNGLFTLGPPHKEGNDSYLVSVCH